MWDEGCYFISVEIEAPHSGLSSRAGKKPQNSWLPMLLNGSFNRFWNSEYQTEHTQTPLKGCCCSIWSLASPGEFEFLVGLLVPCSFPPVVAWRRYLIVNLEMKCLHHLAFLILLWIICPFNLYTLLMLDVQGHLKCTLKTRGNLTPATWFNPAGKLSYKAGPLLKKQMLRLNVSVLW